MKIIGYWLNENNASEAHYPDPRNFVDHDWLAKERSLLVSYLSSYQDFIGYRGHSWCRFRCGIPNASMGSRIFTDGVWAWPEGLAHYVEHHGVVLPGEFIEHCRANRWICPSPPLRSEADKNRRWSFDESFWLEWANNRTHLRKP